MKKHPEFLILKDHRDMYDIDLKKNIFIALDNASEEVRLAVENLNKKINS